MILSRNAWHAEVRHSWPEAHNWGTLQMTARRNLIVAILIAAGLTGAIQTKKFIGSLSTTDGGSLAEQNGKLVLVNRPGANAPPIEGLQTVWKISSPYLQTAKGKYLAIDQTDDDVKVYLADKPGETTKWVIDVLETTSPKRPSKGSLDERRMLVGTSQSKFRLSIFDGRYKGYYLASNPMDEHSPPAVSLPRVLSFRVVKNPKDALTFDYVDTSYQIDHK